MIVDPIRAAIENLGKFDVIDEIAEGASAYAYAARHRDLQERRFLKAVYLPRDDSDSILREPRSLLLALQVKPVSENIVRLFDAERIPVNGDEYVLLQMEWLDGSSFQTLLDAKTFGQQDAVRVTIEILQGVAALHRQRLVHRDLKPGNIIMHGQTPKIADFGSVSRIAENSEFVHASQHSALYVPCEGWSYGKYTFSSDLYQVGLVFYQLVNGPLPLKGEKYLTRNVLNELRKKALEYSNLDDYEKTCAERQSFAELTGKEKLVDHVSKMRPYVSPVIRRILKRSLRADHTKRYETGEDFLNALSKVSTPDWLPVQETFEAYDWRNANWRVYISTRKQLSEAVVEKARANKYRRVHNANRLEEAFTYVETYIR